MIRLGTYYAGLMCEQFFHNQQTIKADKIGLATFHMLGEDHMYHMKLEQEEQRLTWDSLKTLFLAHFGPPLRNNPLGQWSI